MSTLLPFNDFVRTARAAILDPETSVFSRLFDWLLSVILGLNYVIMSLSEGPGDEPKCGIKPPQNFNSLNPMHEVRLVILSCQLSGKHTFGRKCPESVALCPVQGPQNLPAPLPLSILAQRWTEANSVFQIMVKRAKGILYYYLFREGVKSYSTHPSSPRPPPPPPGDTAVPSAAYSTPFSTPNNF